MSDALSNYLENKLLDVVLSRGSYTAHDVFIGLFTTDPTDAGTGTEVSGGSYVRQPVTFTAASGGAAGNTADIFFPVASSDWGTITHFALFDAKSGGNMLFHAALDMPKVMTIADQFKFPQGYILPSLS